MAINKSDLKDMNDLLGKGKTIAQIAKKYSSYDYREIKWELNDVSFLGKKRTITNRLKKLVFTKTRAAREELAQEAQEMLNELYHTLKSNSKNLIDIDRILRR